MAKYVFALRNVRQAHEVEAVGVKDAPRGKAYYFVHDDTGNATDAELIALIKEQFPSMDDTTMADIAEKLVDGNANATVRADDTTGAGSWRYGKWVFQGGVGYHASSEAGAIASINWKSLS